MKKRIELSLDNELEDILDKYTDENHITRQEVIRRTIYSYFKNEIEYERTKKSYEYMKRLDANYKANS